ncbi:hypothetical protein B566_EDAN004788 [Ephemera danica]|nr:hypothetical protein B566_EDAN004788 [Ephemera danica]
MGDCVVTSGEAEKVTKLYKSVKLIRNSVLSDDEIESLIFDMAHLVQTVGHHTPDKLAMPQYKYGRVPGICLALRKILARHEGRADSWGALRRRRVRRAHGRW